MDTDDVDIEVVLEIVGIGIEGRTEVGRIPITAADINVTTVWEEITELATTVLGIDVL